MWPGGLSLVALALAIGVATLPNEQLHLAPNWMYVSTPINTLLLHGEDLIDDAKLAKIIEKNESAVGENRWEPSLSLAGRDLTGADFEEADIRHADFSSATLNGAFLYRARATNAHFRFAQLKGATLAYAQLQGAILDNAQLQGATLDYAQLQGAQLKQAQLQGAPLQSAQLQGASLGFNLLGVSGGIGFIYGAQLQGADLRGAQLQGATLSSAGLQGAMLDDAEVQGAELDGAQLQGASLANAFVWRASARHAFWQNTRVSGSEAGPKHRCAIEGQSPTCDWTAESFEKLKKLIAEHVPEGDLRRNAIEKIEESLDPAKSL